MQYLLLFTVFVISTCGLIYELVAGTLASYLLGDSVTQFSTVIGVYLFSMGVGAFLSKYLKNNLLKIFIQVEILTGFIGGFSSTILFLTFSYVESFRLILYAIVLITGTLVGLEIPLMMRILKNKIEFKDLVSKIFTFDYIGALLASLLFPLIMVPFLGLIRTSVLFGMMNTALALYLCYYFKKEIKRYVFLSTQCVIVLLALLFGFVFSNEIMSFAETQMYGENIIYSTSSHYQRIVLTRKKDDIRLYLNNNLQFSSHDEYRYHEALVHPAIGIASKANNILILGGGDGMAARELLKYASVKKITLVDLDDKLTGLFKTNNLLMGLNNHSLTDTRLELINTDAFEWLKNTKQKYDVIIIDFPDPSNYSVGKLYTTTFYRYLNHVMNDNSVAVVQSTSPLVAPLSYWCVGNTLQDVGYNIVPYHVYVPSFGEWGFFLFSKQEINTDTKMNLASNLKYFSENEFVQMKHFSADMIKRNKSVQKLENQILVDYFEKEWSEY
ncbi:MAG TPA: polyamine aminopropyltransferase [Bacteroidia bacterium]|nr:polyamine aminopropyltransferase [Bacteroidia bacterium]